MSFYESVNARWLRNARIPLSDAVRSPTTVSTRVHALVMESVVAKEIGKIVDDASWRDKWIRRIRETCVSLAGWLRIRSALNAANVRCVWNTSSEVPRDVVLSPSARRFESRESYRRLATERGFWDVVCRVESALSRFEVKSKGRAGTYKQLVKEQIDISTLCRYTEWCFIRGTLAIADPRAWFALRMETFGIERQPKPSKLAVECVRSFCPSLLSALGRPFDEEMIGFAKSLLWTAKRFFEHYFEQITWLTPSAKKKMLQRVNRVKFDMGGPKAHKGVLKKKKDGFASTVFASAVLAKKMRLSFEDAPNYEAAAMYSFEDNTITISQGFLRAPFLTKNMEKTTAGLMRILFHELCHIIDPNSLDLSGVRRSKKREAAMRRRVARAFGKTRMASEDAFAEAFSDIGSAFLASDLCDRALRSANARFHNRRMRQFFRHMASLRRTKMRDKYKRFYEINNPHALPQKRVDASLRVLRLFHRAYPRCAMRAPECNIFS